MFDTVGMAGLIKPFRLYFRACPVNPHIFDLDSDPAETRLLLFCVGLLSLRTQLGASASTVSALVRALEWKDVGLPRLL